MKKFLVINGPNLDQLGKREPEIYGKESLASLQGHTEKLIENKNCTIDWYQSNHEGEIIQCIHNALSDEYHALIINPGGYSHTSVAIYDALKMVKIPIIEVHLSQIYQREDFRQCLLTAKAASKIMSGFGKDSYAMAILSELTKREGY